MSSVATILDTDLRIPPPPPLARRYGGMTPGNRRRRRRLSAVEEAALTFSLGLAFAWALVELAISLGGG